MSDTDEYEYHKVSPELQRFETTFGALLHQIPCAKCGKAIGSMAYRAHKFKQYHKNCAPEATTPSLPTGST